MVFTLFLIVFISSLDSLLALQYTNYTSHQLQVQFQYPSTWKILENKSIDANSIKITDPDPSSGDGDIIIVSKALSDEQASNLSNSGIRVITEIDLQSLDNSSSFEYNVIKYPSYLTIDGNKAGTFLYLMRSKMNSFLEMYTAQAWSVPAGDRYYRIGFLAIGDFFSSTNYTEIRDRFINSIKFLN